VDGEGAGGAVDGDLGVGGAVWSVSTVPVWVVQVKGLVGPPVALPLVSTCPAAMGPLM
jgi:hypothetical protein